MNDEWRSWNLGGLKVTQLKFDFQFHVHIWSLERSLMVIFGSPFKVRWTRNRIESYDPEKVAFLGELLNFLHRAVKEFRACRSGHCTLVFEDGTEVQSEPHPQHEAWESHGTGDLESASLLCGCGGGSPWGN